MIHQQHLTGVMNGRYRVYVDPYAANVALPHNTMLSVIRELHHMTVECSTVPYVPLQMVRAVGESSFQPKIGFKTRYGNC